MGRSRRASRSERKTEKAKSSPGLPVVQGNKAGGRSNSISSPSKQLARKATKDVSRPAKRKRDKQSDPADELPPVKSARLFNIGAKEETANRTIDLDSSSENRATDSDSSSEDSETERLRARLREFKSSPIPLNFSSERGPISTPEVSDDEGMVKFFPNKDKVNTNIGASETSGVTNREIIEKILALQKANQASFDTIAGEVKATQHRISALERHREADAARAAIRHDIMFGVLKKVSHDVNGLSTSCLRQSTAADMEYTMKDEELKQEPGATPTLRMESSQSRVATPRATKLNAKHTKQRGTMEHLLSDWTCKMNEAETVAEVKELGNLLVKYAEDLVKTYI